MSIDNIIEFVSKSNTLLIFLVLCSKIKILIINFEVNNKKNFKRELFLGVNND